ncbi:MAG: hypothetical protein DRN14_04175 [Thermoplasmata archaeon]|nr:MAG: hypothetical protein DRN14_04175 [Thermoplasmata archaeon]
MSTAPHTVKRRFMFSAAHRLPQVDEDHKCHYVHGHNYTVDVEISTVSLDERNFVLDFKDLEFFEEFLRNEFDHKLLVWEKDEKLVQVAFQNTDIFKVKVIPVTPTCEELAELFALYVTSVISTMLSKDFKVRVTVWESDKSCASYETKLT